VLHLLGTVAARHLADIAHDVLGADGLASAGLAADDHALALGVDEHVAVHEVGEGVDVGRVLDLGGACVHLDFLVGEVAELFVGVDGDEDGSDVGVDVVVEEALL